jgi:hypothetical protein
VALLEVGEDGLDLGMAGQQRLLDGELVGMPQVVGRRRSVMAAICAAVSSVEPSSTTRSSRSRKRWASTLRTASRTVWARL